MKNEGLLVALYYSAWGVSNSNYSKNNYLVYAETVVHEFCHAASLGMRIDLTVSDRISRHFDKVNDLSPGVVLTLEAQTLAIERHVLHQLGWLRHFRFTHQMADIYKTGYSGPALPYKTFLSLYRTFLREPSTRSLVVQVIAKLRSIEKEEKRQWKRKKKPSGSPAPKPGAPVVNTSSEKTTASTTSSLSTSSAPKAVSTTRVTQASA